MASRISNNDESDAVEENAWREKELPLPLPFPPTALDEIDSDENHCEIATSNDERRKEALLRIIVVENNRLANDGHDQAKSDAKSSTNEKRQLGGLPSDVFVLLCCSLTVREIASLAKCSKALYTASRNQDLWREKFRARWNFDDPTIINWSVAYRQAYSNPHDLWITHWNCVEPCDSLGPGRCCVQEDRRLRTENKVNKKDGRSFKRMDCNRHLCPSCRYHPCLEIVNESKMSSCSVDNIEEENCEKISISTAAQAIQAATSLRLQESSHLFPCKTYSPNIAAHAFRNASTFHRSVDHRQYKADSLFFLNDLLFFHVHDSLGENNFDDEPFEMRDWKRYYVENVTTKQNDSEVHAPFSDFDTSEPTLHSWHLANVCNPDYDRPIVWRILVQRSDCFAVFPSEGYLLPGESKVVTFGVKPLGSILAHAKQQVNIHRDGVEDFWGILYKKEAHLPCTPFLLQYHYASSAPCHFVDNICLSDIRQQQGQAHLSEHPNPQSLEHYQFSWRQQARSGDSPWRQCSLNQNQYVRSVSLAGHVHANYSLYEFRRKTLVPYTLPSHLISRTEKFLRRYVPREQHSTYSMSPVVFCSPQLMEIYPSEWRRLQALRLEEQRNKSVFATKYRTESACDECGLTWGPRMEELGQAFVMAKLEMESIFQRQRKHILGVHRLLVPLVQQHRNFQLSLDSMKTKSCVVRNQEIIKHLRKKVMNYRGAPWLSRKESRVLLQWEILLDLLPRKTRIHEHNNETRNPSSVLCGGVYRYPTCTDSVFNVDSSFDRNMSDLLVPSDMIIWKDEPNHLQEFSHLACGPGKFFFPHEGRNQKIVRLPKTGGVDDIMTDTFMDDQICALKAAISVLTDSKSLLIHGLFDEILYPGSISRCPKLPILLKLNEDRCLKKIRKQYQTSFDPFIASQAQLAYYELQESLDIQALLIMNSFYSQAASHSISLRHFFKNIPANGSGRFAINTTECEVHSNENFWFLEEMFRGRVSEYSFEDKLHAVHRSNSNKHEVDVHAPSRQIFSPEDVFSVRQVAAENNHGLARGPRILNALWFFSSQLGWIVGNNRSTDSVYVERRILIAAQCLSLTLMLLPILSTLFARYFQLIPAIPTLYHLDGLPYETENKMRFLTEAECGCAGFLLILLYCILYRWIERHTNRHFFRAMVEHISANEKSPLFHRLQLGILEWVERLWDSLTPLALQRMIFLPRWNRRSNTELLEHVAYWRSQKCKERQSTIRAVAGRDGISAEQRDKSITLKDNSRVKKILAFVIMILSGFSASSPYFFLNLLAVSSCSMSLGISTSLQSMEIGQSSFTIISTRSVIESLGLVSTVNLGLLIGQLIGGSGGVLFLVEFAVTATSLVLGGMGTISASGIKSWGTFFCLSLISFWGYLFGRCSVIASITEKKTGISSRMLSTSYFFVLALLLLSIVGWHWETVVDIVIEKPIVIFSFVTRYAERHYRPRQLP